MFTSLIRFVFAFVLLVCQFASLVVSAPEVDLVILAGQSNMVGQATQPPLCQELMPQIAK